VSDRQQDDRQQDDRRQDDRRQDDRRTGDRRPGRPARSPRRPEVDARRVAYDAVAGVHRDDAYANLLLASLLGQAGLDRRDAALATELVYGTLRRRGTLDEIIAVAADRAVERIDPPARDALRLGTYQALFTRIPAHAAVSATVGLVRQVAPGATGFANAVLRRVSERSLEEWLVQVAPPYADDPMAHLAVVHSHPQWIVRAFAEALGGDLVETARLLAADNEPAPVHLCARPGRVDVIDLADESGGSPGAFSPYAVYLPDGAPGDLRAVADGRAHVQDEGSQLVADALAGVPVPGPAGGARRWLDMCAGPGGKAALLGAIAAQRGAHLTAVEVAAHRAALVTQAVRGLPVTVLHDDARTVGSGDALPAAAFDRVLVDAPCTGLGALRRRPEARWRRVPGDLPALTRLQRELLVAAIAAATPGGVIAYATCSPHVVETGVTVAEARRRSPHPTELLDARQFLPAGMPGLGDGPTAQLWPHRHGTDAMFLALLRRSG
jgi:16S rRNA (cytosine967-C5)-methyltransferase